MLFTGDFAERHGTPTLLVVEDMNEETVGAGRVRRGMDQRSLVVQALVADTAGRHSRSIGVQRFQVPVNSGLRLFRKASIAS